jgi:hypothetical protein
LPFVSDRVRGRSIAITTQRVSTRFPKKFLLRWKPQRALDRVEPSLIAQRVEEWLSLQFV